MIKINVDDSVSLDAISEAHFNYLSPKIIERLSAVMTYRDIIRTLECRKPKLKRRVLLHYFKWLGANLRGILLSKPWEFDSLHETMRHGFPRIHRILIMERRKNKEHRLLTNLVSSIFDYNLLAEADLNRFYDKETNELKQIEKQIQDAKYRTRKMEDRSMWFDQLKVNICNELSILSNASVDPYYEEMIDALIADIQAILYTAGTSVEVIRRGFIQSVRALIKKLNERDEITARNYELFKSKYPNNWSAYHLVMELKMRVCPYCNRQFISPYYAVSGKTRADLDHFYSKSVYPFFSLSFYNLIPCCKSCNSSLKNSKQFRYDTHLNPYDYGFEDHYVFQYDIQDVSFLHGSDRIQIRFAPGPAAEDEIVNKARGNVQDFKLEQLYDFHRDLVSEMIVKRQVYDDAWIEGIIKQFENEQLFQSRTDVLEMIFSNFIEKSKGDKRILSKLTRDIAKQLQFY